MNLQVKTLKTGFLMLAVLQSIPTTFPYSTSAEHGMVTKSTETGFKCPKIIKRPMLKEMSPI